MKRPSFQFYPADWRKDPCLSVCSLAARGLWIELMCIAHESAEYGVLSINGKAMTDHQIARSVGESVASVTRLLAELEAAGVFSRDDKGAIFSRRMRKDEHIREVRAQAGRLGGNPNLVKQTSKQTGKQSPTPSSSPSSSTSNPSSVPSGRRQARQDDPEKAELWAIGRQMLEREGQSRDAAGKFLGETVKQYGQRRVLDLLREARVSPPADLRSWLVAACQERAARGANKQAALESENRDVARRFAQRVQEQADAAETPR